MRFFAILLFCCALVFAEKPAFEFVAFPKFNAAELFADLDKVGNNGNWMEYDRKSIEDPSVKDVLKKYPDYKAAWGIAEKGSVARLAVLSKKQDKEYLSVFNLKGFDAKPYALVLKDTLYPEVILADYRGIAENLFAHRDDPALKIQLFNKGLKFTYDKPDAMPLRFDESFKNRSSEEKREIVSEYVDFFKYEYSLMVRAFVQSTRGIFNWQAWHWYMPEWYGRYFISSEEIQGMLSSYARPAMFTIFKARTAKDVLVEMRTDGNGHYEMSINNP